MKKHISLETVRVFSENKAKVILFGSRKETVEKAITELKEEGIVVNGYYPNLSDFNEVKKVVEEINREYGQIDIIVNNAGISANKNIYNNRRFC